MPLLGHLRLEPQPPRGSVYQSATWRGGPDSLVLEWSMEGGLGTPLLIVTLVPHGKVYEGRQNAESDYIIPVPYRIVTARRTSCGR